MGMAALLALLVLCGEKVWWEVRDAASAWASFYIRGPQVPIPFKHNKVPRGKKQARRLISHKLTLNTIEGELKNKSEFSLRQVCRGGGIFVRRVKRQTPLPFLRPGFRFRPLPPREGIRRRRWGLGQEEEEEGGKVGRQLQSLLTPGGATRKPHQKKTLSIGDACVRPPRPDNLKKPKKLYICK